MDRRWCRCFGNVLIWGWLRTPGSRFILGRKDQVRSDKRASSRHVVLDRRAKRRLADPHGAQQCAVRTRGDSIEGVTTSFIARELSDDRGSSSVAPDDCRQWRRQGDAAVHSLAGKRFAILITYQPPD